MCRANGTSSNDQLNKLCCFSLHRTIPIVFPPFSPFRRNPRRMRCICVCVYRAGKIINESTFVRMSAACSGNLFLCSHLKLGRWWGVMWTTSHSYSTTLGEREEKVTWPDLGSVQEMEPFRGRHVKLWNPVRKCPRVYTCAYCFQIEASRTECCTKANFSCFI